MSKVINRIERKVGESINISLLMKSGEFTEVQSVTSALKVANEDFTISDNADDLIRLSVTPIPNENRWFIHLTSPNSATLQPGWYVLDVRILVGVDVVYTDTIHVEFTQGVTDNA